MKDKQSEADLNLCHRWWIFTRERFPPLAHVPVIGFIVLANAAMACRIMEIDVAVPRFILSLVVALMFFYRLRCFDEIKDYKVDLELNPTRPLARGVLKIREVKQMFVSLTVMELIVAAIQGPAALATHALAVGYSYLMYKEFFIGRILRPHLTTYAVTHTFVSILLGWSVAAQVTRVPFWQFPGLFVAFSFVNWMLFNVFEFARKTFSAEEETVGADSYSRRFRPMGAVVLCLSQILIAVSIVAWMPAYVMSVPAWWPGDVWSLHAVLACLPAMTGIIYGLQPTQLAAKIYRGMAGIYQLLFYLLISWQGLVSM